MPGINAQKHEYALKSLIHARTLQYENHIIDWMADQLRPSMEIFDGLIFLNYSCTGHLTFNLCFTFQEVREVCRKSSLRLCARNV